jgi:hypothetical protein
MNGEPQKQLHVHIIFIVQYIIDSSLVVKSDDIQIDTLERERTLMQTSYEQYRGQLKIKIQSSKAYSV